MGALHTSQHSEVDDPVTPRVRGSLMSSDALRAALRAAFHNASTSASAADGSSLDVAVAPLADVADETLLGSEVASSSTKASESSLRITPPIAHENRICLDDDMIDIPFVQALLDELTDEEREDAERVLHNYVTERRRRGLR